MVTARGLTAVTLVLMFCGTAWAENPPVGHGIHAFDWRVRIVEPDGTIDD